MSISEGSPLERDRIHQMSASKLNDRFQPIVSLQVGLLPNKVSTIPGLKTFLGRPYEAE